MIEVELPDGTVLEFPEGTPTDVIQSSARKIMGVQGAQQPVQQPVPAQPEPTLMQRAKETILGRPRSAAPEGEDPYETLAREQNILQSGAIAAGRGLTKLGRAVGLVDPEGETERRGYQALKEQRPATTFVGEAVGESLPFAIPGLGAAGIASKAGRIATTGILGAMESGLIAKGEGVDAAGTVTAGGIGGVTAAGLEAMLPFVGRFAGKLVRKVTGKTPKKNLFKPDGQPTKELQNALDESGLTLEDLTEGALQEMRTVGPEVAKDQAARKAFLEQQGFKEGAAPTTAQIRRTASDFQAQQEAAKTSNIVRGRIENQNALLLNRFDETIGSTGGNPVTSGSPVFDHVLNKSTELDNEIHDMYQMAKQVTGDKEAVPAINFFNKLEQLKPENDLTGGLITALEGVAKNRNIYDPKTGVSRNVTVKEAEDLVKSINARYSASNANANRVSRILKDAIDDDVMKAGGPDLFKQARAAKAKFERDLNAVNASKFGRRKKSLVRDILEETIDPDNLLEKGVLSKSYRAQDIRNLKKYLHTGTDSQKEAGLKAWNDLRAETVDYIKNQAFKGAPDELGNQTITRNRLEGAIKKIGPAKMKELFSPDEQKFFSDMHKTLKIMEPVPGTALGKGPSAQAIGTLWDQARRRIDKIDILKAFGDVGINTEKAVLEGKPVQKFIPQPIPVQQLPYLGTAAAVPLSMEQEQQQGR